MSRPSRNMDRRLIETGLRMIPETGFSGLKIRRIAKKAGVNLGMFHYYFKTKDEFAAYVLQEFYEKFFRKFLAQSTRGNTPLEQLRGALNALAQYGRDHRDFFLVLLQDALQGYRPTIGFAKKNIPRHLGIVINLLRQCQNQGQIKKMPFPIAVSLLMGSVAVPNAVVALMERTKAKRPFGMSLKQVQQLLLSDSAIAERVNLVLKALSK